MPVRQIAPTTLNQWLRAGSAVLVDVREPAEHRASHIAGAALHPLSRFAASSLSGHQGRLVIHCLKGGRGAQACEKLLAANPALEVYNLSGGIEGWAAAGLPVERGASRILPLDRQVQLTIGLVLLASLALSLAVNPAFVWLAGVVGLGLTIAGLTGICGLAMVMARMPWNRA